MADKVIWNDSMTMNFLAHEYQAARIIYPHMPADEGHHWIRVHLRGAIYNGENRAAGLAYATCSSKEEAKKCLAKLVGKLIRAGVIEETETESENRFDHVELQEVTP